MYLSTLPEWMTYIESIHATEIDLGLERVKSVAERLGVLSPPCSVVIVGGTNGKGSTVFGLESIYRSANYRTGLFNSPYLFKINEQIRINGQMVTDEELCEAFAKVEEARQKTSLTSFEFFTLAGLYIFQQHGLDVWILEVGLGGRLDAVNIMDADVSVITSIDIDHVNWLGHTREQIGFEKAGIFRSGRPAVCGDFNPPPTVSNAPLYLQGRDFDFQEATAHWSWGYQATHYQDLPRNSLMTQNMSVVLMVVTLLQNRLPVAREAIDQGLQNVHVPGRIEIVNKPVMEIYDVSHNPAAVKLLTEKIKNLVCDGKTYAVFSMLADKDITTSLQIISDEIDYWYVAPLQNKRAASMEVLKESFQGAGIKQVKFFMNIEQAYSDAVKQAQEGDRIIVFGSFHTVADVRGNM